MLHILASLRLQYLMGFEHFLCSRYEYLGKTKCWYNILVYRVEGNGVGYIDFHVYAHF